MTNYQTRRNETTPVETLNLADALTAERPAVGAHIDNTADGGPQVILNHLTDEQKDRLLGQGYRFRLIKYVSVVLVGAKLTVTVHGDH